MLNYTNNFQDASTKVINKVFVFHFYVISLMFSVLFLVGLMLVALWHDPNYTTWYKEDDFLETMWTITPFILICTIAAPSIYILSLMETPSKSLARSHTLKAMGHQWYWSYEYYFKNVFYSYDSYMMASSDLSEGDFRLLEVDNPVVLQNDKWYRMIVTSEDVMHSFSVPSLGIKIDGMPGRLNQQSLHPETMGVYYGQCSEICGANHSFMPIVTNMMP